MKNYNLFISHSWKYSDHYIRLVAMLQGRGYFTFSDYSVPETNPILGANSDKALAEAIDRQIRPASVVIISAGMYVSRSKWIQKEIEMARKYSKPVIVVRPQSAVLLPSAATENADMVVGWNADSIVAAIRELCG